MTRQVFAVLLPDYDMPIQIASVELEDPGPNEVLVEMRASGVCHSDWHAVTGHLPLPVPLVLGHEGAGIVREVGSHVRTVKPGDHVVLSWVPSCGRCPRCLTGQPELCEQANDIAVAGTLPDGETRMHWKGRPVAPFSGTGTLADMAVVSERSVIAITHVMPFDEAALLGCSVQTGIGAAFHSPIQPADSVAVIGCGGVGLNIVQGARILGAARILAVDPSPANRQLATELGATTTIDPSSEDPLLAILDHTQDQGVDVAFEAVGNPDLIALAFNAARRGGTAVAVGVPTPNASLVLNAFAFPSQEKTLTGSWYGGSYPPRDIPRLIALWEQGKLQLSPLIQRRYRLSDTPQAFSDLVSARGGRGIVAW